MMLAAVRRVWRSLYGRISLLYLGLSLALCLACAWVTVCHFRTFMGAVNQRLDRNLAASLAPQIEAAASDASLDQAVDRVAQNVKALRPAVQLHVVDASGRLESTSLEASYVKRDRIHMEPVTAFVGGATAPVRGTDPASTRDRKVFSAAPIEGPDGQTDYLYVILNGCSADAIASTFKQTYVWRTFASSLLLALGFTTVVGLALFWLLTRRFRALTDVVRRFKEGDYDERVDDGANDEIGQLGRTFNEMADTIGAQVEALRRTDEKRRRLVAEVSHDLRTPLTSIQGHAERLLNTITTAGGDGRPAPAGAHAGDGAPRGRQGDPAQRVETILQNATRMDDLADRLHELSRLDAGEEGLDPESFSLAELAHDLVVKLRPDAEARGLTLDMDIEGTAPAVHADIGMIERLLSNLVENAMENTPRGGAVDVHVGTTEGAARVQVRDSGIGIPEAELPLVTQRFYRVDRGGDGGPDSAGGDAEQEDGGSGLGLAIAAEIAEAHGGDLEIESEEGEGTTVRVDLPVAE